MHWNDIDEIAERLNDDCEEYYRIDLELQELKKLVLSLKDFEDIEVSVTDTTLEEILEAWEEIRNEED